MDRTDMDMLRSLSCESVAQRLGIVVKQHKALCCFHDDHNPSLTFRGGRYRCWSCGASGDSISLVMRCLNKSFTEACRWLAEEHNVTLSTPNSSLPAPHPFDASRYERFFERPYLNEEARRFLFEERRLDERVVRWCRLTSWKDRQGVPWLQIPYYDREWRLVGVQSRNLVKGAIPRFRFPAGCDTSLYGLPVLNRLHKGEKLFIAEGVTDCLALMSSGRPAIAVPSATLLKRKDGERLRDLAAQLQLTLGMYPDNDAPGITLYNQLKDILPGLIRYELPPGCKDYSEYYLRTGG